MSGTISTLGQLLDTTSKLNALKSQLNTLQVQMASNKKSDTIAGLGNDAITAMRTRVDMNQIDVYQTNITLGIARVKIMTNTVNEVKEQAKNFADTMANKLQMGTVDLDDLKSFAKTTRGYLRELLNVKDGDKYLMSGSDAYVAPLGNSSAQDTYMTQLLNDWQNGTIDTDTLIKSYSSTPDTTMGYSATLSTNSVNKVFIRADVSTEVDYTTLANQQGFKDILNGLALIENMSLDKISLGEGDDPLTTKTAPGATAEDQKNNFFKMYEQVIKQINGGVAKLNLEEQRLQRAELQLQTISQEHKADRNNLESAIGKIEDIDPTELAVKINALQIQLTASYQVTGQVGQMSLARFL